jgi:hypothetical protein
VVEHPRLFLGEDDHATGSVRETFEHVHSSRAACVPAGATGQQGVVRC